MLQRLAEAVRTFAGSVTDSTPKPANGDRTRYLFALEEQENPVRFALCLLLLIVNMINYLSGPHLLTGRMWKSHG
jgi:hypothetical protein